MLQVFRYTRGHQGEKVRTPTPRGYRGSDGNRLTTTIDLGREASHGLDGYRRHGVTPGVPIASLRGVISMQRNVKGIRNTRRTRAGRRAAATEAAMLALLGERAPLPRYAVGR